MKRRVDKILRVSPSAAWKYIYTSQNPADVGTRGTAYKKPEFVKLWLGGPEFLALTYVDVCYTKHIKQLYRYNGYVLHWPPAFKRGIVYCFLQVARRLTP